MLTNSKERIFLLITWLCCCYCSWWGRWEYLCGLWYKCNVQSAQAIDLLGYNLVSQKVCEHFSHKLKNLLKLISRLENALYFCGMVSFTEDYQRTFLIHVNEPSQDCYKYSTMCIWLICLINFTSLTLLLEQEWQSSIQANSSVRT